MREGSTDGASTTVVLVEGESDRLAVEALAARWRLDLPASRVAVVPMAGVTNLRAHLLALRRDPAPRRIVGLFDAPEAAHVRRALVAAGVDDGGAADLASLGFFACDPDLEGELIAALGTARVEALLAEHGELARFRTLQQQPFQRSRPVDAQLRRFMGTHSGRKARFAPILVAALDESRIPRALSSVLRAAIAPPGQRPEQTPAP